MAGGPSLGAEWIAAHGQGRLAPDQSEELRSQLLRDLSARGGDSASNVQAEVDRFIRNGRVSDANLRRLERKVLDSAGEGARSARGEGARSISEFSQSAASWRSPPHSARLPGGRGRHEPLELDALLQALGPGGAADAQGHGGLARTLPAVPEAVAQKLGKWSEVARYAKLVEDKEKEERRETRRQQQLEMRRDLQLQMEEKKLQKQRAVVEDQLLHKSQEAELRRWRDTQDAEREGARKMALEVHKVRLEQSARTSQMREQEREQKRDEDHRLVQKAAQELDMEVQKLKEKKLDNQRQQQRMVADMKEEEKQKEEQRKIQAAEERRKVREHCRMADEQARNRTNTVVRDVPEMPAPGISARQRAREVYSEENVMQQLKETNRRAEEAELQRMERAKVERQSNQDFLFRQISERDRLRRQAKDQKGSAKLAAQEAAKDYVDTERQRIEDRRMRNIQYRLELEQQISAKRAGQLPRQTEDQMSRAERAINRRLLREVVDLHSERGATGQQAAAALGGDDGG